VNNNTSHNNIERRLPSSSLPRDERLARAPSPHTLSAFRFRTIGHCPEADHSRISRGVWTTKRKVEDENRGATAI
jgi:hypothetical protein